MGRTRKIEAANFQNTREILYPVKRKLAIEYRLITTLRPDPRNPRLHSKKQIRQIARSIETFGFIVPVLIDSRGQIIAGHGLVLAAQLLGMTHVPTIMIEHLTEAQIRTFEIADNRLTENSVWDDRLLAEQLKELSGLDVTFGLETTGFEMSQIDLMIESLAPASCGKDDPADRIPDSRAQPGVTQVVDLWILDHHRVHCGNARDESRYSQLMQDRRAQMVFTDPPYNDRIDGYVTNFGKVHHPEFAEA